MDSRGCVFSFGGGIVASSQTKASQIGVDVLRSGGNAADAAIATAAALCVLEPCSTGVGGDAFMLFFDSKTQSVRALNGSGRAPSNLPPMQCFEDIVHAANVTVPGAVALWWDMHEKLCSMPMQQLLEPAIRVAEDGFPVGKNTAHLWHKSEDLLRSKPNGHELLNAEKNAPKFGEVFRNPHMANVLKDIIKGKDAFYGGRVGQEIVNVVQANGGTLTMDDLRQHRSTWEEPVTTKLDGNTVHECPPNGQGIAALLALNIFSHLPQTEPSSVARYHAMIEAMKLAFADTRYYVCDPAFCPVPSTELLSESYARDRAKLVDMQRASHAERGRPVASNDTVYFCCVDKDGNACSFVQSNYMGFGTGIVPASCGFSLQNRGQGFKTRGSDLEGHPNRIAPGKRPYHTIIPGLVTRADGSLLGPFGVMGGFMQPQGHFQLLVSHILNGENPQAALDAPRFCIDESGRIDVEEHLPETVVEGLRRLGHQVHVVRGFDRKLFGRGQLIVQNGAVLCAGSDGRCDGAACAH